MNLERRYAKYEDKHRAEILAQRVQTTREKIAEQDQEKEKLLTRLVQDLGPEALNILGVLQINIESVPGEEDDYDQAAVKFSLRGEDFYLTDGGRTMYRLNYRPVVNQGGRFKTFYVGADVDTTLENLFAAVYEALSDIDERRTWAARNVAKKTEEVVTGPYRCDQVQGETAVAKQFNQLRALGYKVKHVLFQQGEPGYNGEVVIISRKRILGVF